VPGAAIENVAEEAEEFGTTVTELAAEIQVGRCTLTPPDPQLKGAWYPGGFKPCTCQVKTRFQNVAFKRYIQEEAVEESIEAAAEAGETPAAAEGDAAAWLITCL
jgi:hypothetical protein